MAGTKSKWQLPQKNVEEKDSKTVALISLLVTVFFFCIVVIVILNTHLTRKNGAAYQICVHHRIFSIINY